MKARTKQKYEGTQALKVREHVKHTGTQGTYDTKAREASNLSLDYSDRINFKYFSTAP